MPNQT